jgi:pimeloyl-ACP methyl ester carboxylesterase
VTNRPPNRVNSTGAHVEMISGAGHFMFEDDPVRFCAAVTEFLEE